jgi:hypothetical protein
MILPFLIKNKIHLQVIENTFPNLYRKVTIKLFSNLDLISYLLGAQFCCIFSSVSVVPLFPFLNIRIFEKNIKIKKDGIKFVDN